MFLRKVSSLDRALGLQVHSGSALGVIGVIGVAGVTERGLIWEEI